MAAEERTAGGADQAPSAIDARDPASVPGAATLDGTADPVEDAGPAESDHRLAEDISEAVDLVAVVDRDLRFVYVNQAVGEIAGRTVESWIGRRPAEIGADPSASGRLTTALADVFATGEPRIVHVHLPRHGLDVEARITPRRDEAGRVDRAVVVGRDVTEQLRDREELESERRRLAATIGSLFDPLVELAPVRDASGEVVDFVYTGLNDAACAFHHARPEDMVGRRLSELLPDDLRAAMLHGYAELIDAGSRLAVDDLLIPAGSTGEGLRIDVRVVRVGDALVVTWRDMTERRAVDERFRIFAENSSDVVIMAPGDVDATTWISPSVTRVLGWRPEDWLGHSPVEFIHPEDLERLMKDLDADRGLGEQVDEYRVQRPDGAHTWVSVASSTVQDADGEVVLRVAVLRDITSTVEAQERLAASEERYRLLVETVSDVIFQTDALGIIEWVSPTMADVLGWEPDELIGTSSFDLLAPEDRVPAVEPLRHQPPNHPAFAPGADAEVRFRQADGRLRWMAVRARPFFDDAGQPLGAVIGLRDCHEEVLIRRAVRTQEAGHLALASADDEQELLELICQAAVDRGGYLFAWYGRRRDEDHRVEPVAASQDHRRYLDRVDVRWDEGPLGQGPGGRSIRAGHTVVFDDLRTAESFGPWMDAARDEGFRSTICLPICVDDDVDGSLMVYASDRDPQVVGG